MNFISELRKECADWTLATGRKPDYLVLDQSDFDDLKPYIKEVHKHLRIFIPCKPPDTFRGIPIRWELDKTPA